MACLSHVVVVVWGRKLAKARKSTKNKSSKYYINPAALSLTKTIMLKRLSSIHQRDPLMTRSLHKHGHSASCHHIHLQEHPSNHTNKRVCVCVCVGVGVPACQRKASDPIIFGCKCPGGTCEVNSGPLGREFPVLLTAESSLQLSYIAFFPLLPLNSLQKLSHKRMISY